MDGDLLADRLAVESGRASSTTSNRIDSGRPGARSIFVFFEDFYELRSPCDCQALASTIFVPLVVVNGSGSTYFPALASV